MEQSKIVSLCQEMSLEEKVNQLLQVVGNSYLDETVITGPMRENGFTEENLAQAGSVLGTLGAKNVKEIQKKYMEKHPHKIPLLFMLDIINGFRTVFPIPLGQGATFEPELSKRCAAVAAKEAAVSGLHVTFAPMVDLVRDARWGRVMESTGEDTYLNSLFSRAMVEGFQGNDIREPYRIAACVKHFAGYGAPDAGRDYNTVELSEHTFRQFYLPSYQAGIDAGAAMVMTSFNTINGVPSTGNRHLMRDILRDEMKFDGVLISDWAAIEELIYHGYCADREEAAIRSIEAGVDIDMMTGIYSQKLCDLVKSGVVKEGLVDEAVLRILTLKNQLGLFENPYKDADEDAEKEVILCEEHRNLAREAAVKSFVLLKNEGALPISKEESIAFIGPYVDNKNISGAWSFIGKAEDSVSMKDAAIANGIATENNFVQGCPMLGNEIHLEGFSEETEGSISEAEIMRMEEEAVALAKRSEIVVMALGEHRLQSGEATSNATIQIPAIQEALFEKVYAVNPNIVVVLFTGRPLDLRNISQKAKAILTAWLPGTEGGNAILDALLGVHNPSGKLAMSFPYSVGQVPIHYNEYATGRPHVKGKDKDRFRSKYLDIPNEALYPFGFGLSYTSFDISGVTLDKDKISKGETLQASIAIKNTGKFVGEEVVQLYIKDVTASVVRPLKELKGFQKITLAPGQSEKVTFLITEKELEFYTENAKWESEAGLFELFIGSDSATENKTAFRLV